MTSPSFPKTKDREAKWESYLTSSVGKDLLACLQSRNPEWDTAKKVASQISSLYKFSSFDYHSSANAMHEAKNQAPPGAAPTIDMSLAKSNAKIFGIAMCIAEHIGFQVYLGGSQP